MSWREARPVRTLLAICAAILALSAQPALACRNISRQAALEAADFVFIGTPVKISPQFRERRVGPGSESERFRVFQFQVNQVLKGPSLRAIAVTAEDHSCSGLFYIDWEHFIDKRGLPSSGRYLSSRQYLIHAIRDKQTGRYKTSMWFPSGPLPERIDPRFPSVIWRANPNRLAVKLYWMTRDRSRYVWGFEDMLHQPAGLLIPGRDGVLHPIP